MAQLYCITNVKNNKKYIGIVFGKNKTYLDRFEEHLIGKGSVYIYKEILDGISSCEDFKVSLLFEEDKSTIFKLECQYIRKYNSLYPNGYNGNVGNQIVDTQEVKLKRQKTRRERFKQGLYKKTGTVNCGIYVVNGKNVSLPLDHPDVLSGKVKHVNYKGIDIKLQLEKEEKMKQREKNGGYTDKQVSSFKYGKDNLINNVVGSIAWQKGRDKLRERMKRKEFTEKELENFKKRPIQTKKIWEKRSKEETLNITSAGLNAMNSKIKCEHCGKLMNKGNYNRWHGINCKDKEKI